jgi:hypothetical protein
MWQCALVEFAEQEDYNKICARWSIPFKGELLRIYPLLKTFEIKQTRDKHTLRLTNLPPETTGYDLRDVISTTKAASCHIPRNRNYTKKRFAFLNFISAEAKEQAKNQEVYLGETPLYWHEVDEKLCAICSAADHLVANCPIKAKRQEKQQLLKEKAKRYNSLYQKFKPAGTANIRRIVPKQTSKPTNQDRLRAWEQFNRTSNRFADKGTFAQIARRASSKGSNLAANNPAAMINLQSSLTEVLKAVQTIGAELKDIKETINDLNSRVNNLEEFAYFYTVDDEEQVQAAIETGKEYLNQNPPRTTTPEPRDFNYQRKRQATSPAVDTLNIREQQINLNTRMANIDDTFQSVVGTLNQIIDITTNTPQQSTTHEEQ